METLRTFQLKHYFRICQGSKYFNYNYVYKKIARYIVFEHSHIFLENNLHIAYWISDCTVNTFCYLKIVENN